MSFASLTNETAMISTSNFFPNFISSISFLVIAETDNLESGKATPWFERNSPPISITASIDVLVFLVTLITI